MKRRAFASGVILVLILATVAFCGRGAPEEPAPAADENARPPRGSETVGEPPAPESAPAEGEVTAMATHVALSPQAQIQAEALMCVCGCGLRLGQCSCSKEPGGITMKRYLQSLVDKGLTPSEVKAAMVEKYGQAVLP